MKKSAILAVMLVVVMLVCCACGIKDVEPKNTQTENAIFKKYCNGYGGIVVVDTETNVMYWLSEGNHNLGSLTLLVNEDGTPKLYQKQE